jgi:LysM repeat protein
VGGVRLVNRRLLARYVAPAAFLLAVTAVVLVVRSALRTDAPTTTTTTAAATTRATPARTPTHPAAPKQYYVIATGDTLDAIAARFGTTVTELLRLNPGVQPTALRPGEHVRVR